MSNDNPNKDSSDQDPIEVSVGKRGGQPVFRGTRVPISYLAQYLQHGYTTQDFIEQYDIDPGLVREVYQRKFGDQDQGQVEYEIVTATC